MTIPWHLQTELHEVKAKLNLGSARMATALSALLLIITTITLLPLLHNLVPAERPVALLEAVVLPVVHHGVQHRADVLQTARRELVVVLSVSGGGRRKHDEVAASAAGSTFDRIIVGRAKIVANLMGKGELGHLGGHPAVVVDKCDDARVETSLGSVVDPVDILGVGFVLFTDASTCATGGGNPCEAKGTSSEVPICEDIGQAELLVVLLRVQVQEVGHVNVGQAELLVLPVVPVMAVGVVEDLDPVHVESVPRVSVLPLGKLCVPVDPVDGLHVLRNHAQDLLLRLLLIPLLLVHVLPQQWVGLDEERARFLVVWWFQRPLHSLSSFCVLVLGTGVFFRFTSATLLFSLASFLPIFFLICLLRGKANAIRSSPLHCCHPCLHAWRTSTTRSNSSKLQY